jgi:transcriptional regulator with XRE-family HTH domain
MRAMADRKSKPKKSGGQSARPDAAAEFLAEQAALQKEIDQLAEAPTTELGAWGQRADDGTRAALHELAFERFQKLIYDLGAERGYTRGWKSLVALMLGITPEHLSRIMKGKRNVSVNLMQRVARDLGFMMEYFTQPAEDATYKQFMERPPAPRPPDPKLAPPPVHDVHWSYHRPSYDLEAVVQRVLDGAVHKTAPLDLKDVQMLAHAVMRMPMVEAARATLNMPWNDASYATWAGILAFEYARVFTQRVAFDKPLAEELIEEADTVYHTRDLDEAVAFAARVARAIEEASPGIAYPNRKPRRPA